MRKIILFFILIISFLFNFWFVSAEISDSEVDNLIDDEFCKMNWDCLNKSSFTIDVSWDDWLMPNTLIEWETTWERVNFLLWIIIQKLMIALWVLSVFIMTVGWWYMIMNNWQDELLNKWKKIFMSGIIAMVIALSSYIIISLFRFILYS